MRYGEMTAFEERPHSPYFGNADATPLFVVLLDEYERWTGDTKLVRELEYEARAALNWIDEYANLQATDTSGISDATRRPASRTNAGRTPGTPSRPVMGRPGFPRATCELQGYAYDAKIRAARLARTVWKDLAFADELEKQAADLKRRFNRDFWVAEDEYFALALDENGEQVDALSSNNGHLLWSGIVDKSKAKAVARHLMGPQLFSGWGVRTLATVRGATTRSAITSAPCGRSTTRSSPGDYGATASRQKPHRSRRESSTRPPSSTADCPKHSADIRATRRSTRSNTRPRAVRKHGRPARPCFSCARCSASNRPGIISSSIRPARRHGADRAARHPRPLGPHRRLRPRAAPDGRAARRGPRPVPRVAGLMPSPPRKRSCGRALPAASRSRAGGRPAVRPVPGARSARRWPSHRRRTRRSTNPPRRGGTGCSRPASGRPARPAPAARRISASGVSQTVSASGMRARSASVSGGPSSRVKANRPPVVSAREISWSSVSLSGRRAWSRAGAPRRTAGRERGDLRDLEATGKAAGALACDVDGARAEVDPQVGATQLPSDEPSGPGDSAAQVEHGDPGCDAGRRASARISPARMKLSCPTNSPGAYADTRARCSASTNGARSSCFTAVPTGIARVHRPSAECSTARVGGHDCVRRFRPARWSGWSPRCCCSPPSRRPSAWAAPAGSSELACSA